MILLSFPKLCAGVDKGTVAMFTVHKTIQTTVRDAHLAPEHESEA
jgi:hypothetical protein